MLRFVSNRLVPHRLRTLLLVLLLVTLLPGLVVQSAVFVTWCRTLSQSEIEANLELARSVASLFSDFVQEVRRESTSLAASLVRMNPLNVKEAEWMLANCKAEHPPVRAFHWIAPDGSILASSDPKMTGQRLDAGQFFRPILEGQDFILSNRLEGMGLGEPFFVIASGERSPDRTLQGVLAAVVTDAQLSSVFEPIARSEGSAITLFDREGQRVFRHPDILNMPTGAAATADPLLAAALTGKEAKGRLRSAADDRARFAGRLPVASLGWVAGASRPVSDTLAPIVASLAPALIMTVLTIAVSALLSMALYRRILGSLSLLQEHTEAVGRGEPGRHIAISGVREFRTLADAFNTMAEHVHDALGAARAANVFLEHQVNERTTALREVNESLLREIAERRAIQDAVSEQSRILEGFYRHAMTPLVILDRDFNFIRVNDAYAKACQRAPEDFPGHNHFEFYPSEELEGKFREVVQSKEPYEVFARPFSFADHPEWGVTYWDLAVSPILDASGDVEFLVFSLVDVTERTQTERREEVLKTVQWLFTTGTSQQEYLDLVVQVIQDWSGCRNVGIRVVNEQREVLFQSYAGYSPDFMRQEKRLTLDAPTCICTRVIAGRFEASEAIALTTGRSFRCEDTHAWFEGLTPEERTHYRGACIANGFASLAVIPIRYRGEPLGAIHLSDPDPGRVPVDNVEFLESLAPLVGEAIHRFSVENALRTASHHARSLIEASLDPLVTISPDGKITDVNRATEAVTGLTRDTLIGSDFSDYATEPEKARSGYQRVLAEGKVTDYPLTIRHANGALTDVMYNAAVYTNETGEVQGVFAAARDITERKRAEAELSQYREHLEDLVAQRTKELQRLNEVLMARNRSEQAVMRARDELEYLNEICRIIVENCGHAMVWVGLAEDDAEKTVRPVASYGFDSGYLETLKITWADTERGRGPTGTAIRTGTPATCRNMLTDPQFAPWREEALKRGYASSLVLPMFDGSRAFGAITVYSREPGGFTDAETETLSELANDAAFGLAAIRLRLAHARALESLQQAMRLGRIFAFEWDVASDLVLRTAECGEVLGLSGLEATRDTSARYFQRVYPEDREEFLQVLKGLAPENDTYKTTYRVTKPNGEFVILEEIARGFFDERGQLKRLVGMTADVTVRKQQEEALRRAHNELERRVAERTAALSELNTALIEEIQQHSRTLDALRRSERLLAEAQRMTHSGSWEWNLATGELHWSDEVFRIFGHAPRAFPPAFSQFLEQVHPEDRGDVEGLIQHMASIQDKKFSLRHRILRPDGEVRIVHVLGEMVHGGAAETHHVLGTILDITERIHAEEESKFREQQLVQAEKMVSLGILVSGVAHEINNPNHAIMANLSTLAGVWDSILPILDRFYEDFGDFVLGGFDYSECRDKLADMYAVALASCRRIEVIVTELRDYARYRPTEKMAPVDINAVVESAIILITNMIQKSTDHFSVEYGADLPPVFGNFQRIEQVFINLLQNACQALSRREQRIHVSTTYARESDAVMIEIQDDGKGIPEKDLKRLGDPFFTTKRGAGGMGLGLWISFNIVHEHGGSLTFSSREGHGTKAQLSLPVKQAPEPEKQEVHALEAEA